MQTTTGETFYPFEYFTYVLRFHIKAKNISLFLFEDLYLCAMPPKCVCIHSKSWVWWRRFLFGLAKFTLESALILTFFEKIDHA